MRVGRVAGVAVFVAMALLWIYIFSGVGRQDPPDRLDSAVFPERAEAVCAATRERLDALPDVTHESPPEELAATVGESADLLGAQLDELSAVAPTTGRDGRLVQAWLDDWQIHIEDLREWTHELRAGDAYVPFSETNRGGEPLTQAMDNFAEVNDMPSCDVP